MCTWCEGLPPFGRAVRHFRHLLDYTEKSPVNFETAQELLIKKIGMSVGALSNYETGQRIMPRGKYQEMIIVFHGYLDEMKPLAERYPAIYGDLYKAMQETFNLIRQHYKKLTAMDDQ